MRVACCVFRDFAERGVCMVVRRKGCGLLQFFNANVAEGNISVIALEKDRAGLVDFIVKFAAGGFGALDVVVDFYTVEGEADFVAHDCGLGGLPLVAGFGDEFVGRFEIVDGAVAIDGIGAAGVVTQDLNFMTSAEVEAAVRFVGDHVFEFDCEVPKLLVCDEIVAMKVLIGGVLENSVLNGPTVPAVRMAEMPAGGVFAVEERAEAFFVSSASAEGACD
jgi:hypothetical protein